MSQLPDIADWAEVCEAVSEQDEPPIRRCPNCSALGYEIAGQIHCTAGCLVTYSPGSKCWVVLRGTRAEQAVEFESCPSCGQQRLVSRDDSAMTMDCDLCRG